MKVMTNATSRMIIINENLGAIFQSGAITVQATECLSRTSLPVDLSILVESGYR